MTWEDAYIASGAPPLFLKFEMEQLTDIPEMVKAKALEFANNFLSYRRQKYPESKPGLFFIGRQGVGKSALLAVVLKEMIRQDKVVGTARWLSVPLLSMTLKSSYSTHEEELAIVRPFMEADILIVDDLGAAHSKKVEEGVAWLEDRLFVIIEERYCKCRPILATSNLSMTSLPSSLGPRIFSRLHEMTDIIDMNEFVDGDFRKKIARKRKQS